MLFDNTGDLGPTALEVATASLATCLTHTTIMHAALGGTSVESAIAHITLAWPPRDGQALSFAGSLAIGTTAAQPSIGESLAGEALGNCLLVHCFGRANTVRVLLAP